MEYIGGAVFVRAAASRFIALTFITKPQHTPSRTRTPSRQRPIREDPVMLFTFRLAKITCHSVLSTEDSDWGAADGIRVYFLVTSTAGKPELLISGREYPPPDATDNYHFVPGKSLDLDQFPPVGAADWETPPIDVSPGEFATLTVIGLNEGLAFVGGGGGAAPSQTGARVAIEEFSKEFYEEAMEHAPEAAAVTGQVWLAVALALLEKLIEKLNESGNCRGVAFAYSVDVSLGRLLATHLTKKTEVTKVNTSQAITPLHIATVVNRPPGCGTPSYELELETVRHQAIGLKVEEGYASPRSGPPRAFEATWERCATEGEMRVWTEYFDREFTIRPTVPHYTLFHPTWHIDGVPVPASGGSVKLTKQVYLAADPSPQTRDVTIECEVESLADAQALRIETKGIDGNFAFLVSLRYKLADVAPWVTFHETDVFVDGQQLAGNEAYQQYLDCVSAFFRTVTSYKQQKVRLDPRPRPGPWPMLGDVVLMEQHLNGVSRAFEQSPSDLARSDGN